MKKHTIFLFTWIIFFALHSFCQAKIRIAYIEGGEFEDYRLILDGTARELQSFGIIENGNAKLSPGFSSEELWTWLSENAKGSKLEFVKDAYYSGDWDAQKQKENILNLEKRIQEKNDIDLIFAFGTVAGIDVIKNIKNVNIMSMSTTDPVATGISKSAEDSGNDYIHATIEPDLYLKQLTLFHNIFQFENMGICFENSESGKGSIAYDAIKDAASKIGFNLIEGEIPVLNNSFNNIDLRIQCHEELAPQVDAMYLTFGVGNQRVRYIELLQPFIDYRVPTFSQAGPQDVEHGALLSMAAIDFTSMGAFEANVIKEIIDGKKPREISQIYIGRSSIAVNLRMAMEIGWDLSFELLAAVDVIYSQISNDE